jgi:hypothetical protein
MTSGIGTALEIRVPAVGSLEFRNTRMPYQNRVDPCGAILSLPGRGMLMGNRGGVLHNDRHEIVRQFSSRRWITCLLEFKGRSRRVMSPGRYTELFFLDEAVSLAAGHRPCAECRRPRFNAFRDAFQNARKRADEPDTGSALLADEIDAELHRARIDSRGGKVTHEAPWNALPDGCFVQIDGSSYLIWDEALLLWSPLGYLKKEHRPTGLTVTVLTPEPIVRCIRQGYRPEIHKSALAL